VEVFLFARGAKLLISWLGTVGKISRELGETGASARRAFSSRGSPIEVDGHFFGE
jgi:hypothetical protein